MFSLYIYIYLHLQNDPCFKALSSKTLFMILFILFWNFSFAPVKDGVFFNLNGKGDVKSETVTVLLFTINGNSKTLPEQLYLKKDQFYQLQMKKRSISNERIWRIRAFGQEIKL